MGERHSEFERDTDDWYVEPDWAARAVFERVNFIGEIHDPCCGMGTIVRAAQEFQYTASGSDIVDRGYGFGVQDFLKDYTRRHNIVTNPPYAIAHQIVGHALHHTTGRVAVLTQLKFLASQTRYTIFKDRRMEKVLIFSRRPSMPPGKMLEEHGEKIRGGGSMDFCWLVWNQQARKKTPTVEWII